LRGLCGIPEKSGKIIGPLLRFSASEIEKYAKEQNLEFCVDSSNLTDDFLRNRIRHHIIPEFEKISPKCTETFSENSTLLLQQIQFFDAQIQQYKNQLWKENQGRFTIEIQALKNNDNNLLILYEFLNPYGFNADTVENILKSISSISGKRFLSDTHILIKDRTHFYLEKKKENIIENIPILTIEELEKHGFIVEKKKCNSNLEVIKDSDLIFVDADKLIFPLTIRNWEKGDFFYPFGMKNKKKLSDFFIDLKIDLLEKTKIRILTSQNQIVWIVGYRADNRFRVDENTKWYYRIELK